ncbi:peptidase M1-like protein [Labedella gwakjiensis]|nr:M1 family metallopeptidase [Labedella gwakjiensis]PSL39113.1 peptidase M1-like protein [Labedella gwakjiensis]
MPPISSAVRSSRPRLSRCAAGVLALSIVGAGAFVAAPAHAAEPGGQTTGDSLFPNVGNTGYDVQHYDIAVDYDHDTGSIDATTEITATASVELSSFSLDLEGLTVDSVLVNGAPAGFTRIIDADTTTYKLVITPATPVTGEFTTTVEYSGVPTEHIDPDGSSEGWVATPDGATAVSEPVGAMTWFPNNNTPLDKATFDIDLTIPTTIGGGTAAAVSNGELVGRVDDAVAGTTTWSWEQTEQMTTYLSLVSIGRYDIYESTVTLPSGRTIPEWSFIDSDLSTQRKTTSLASRDQIETVLGYLETAYGPYPGNSTGIVVDNVGVGYALETQDRSFFDRSASRGTLIHELVHQWFGDAVTLSDWSDIWLNEGPAEHITSAATAALYGGDDTEAVWYSEWEGVPDTDSAWTVPVAGFDDPADLFGFQSYSRSGMALEALRLSIGDEAFQEIFREWYERLNGSDGSTADFIALAEEISGADLDAFFQDWLFDTNKPAWPNVWGLDLASSAPTDAPLSRGDTVDYTLTAANTGLGGLTGATVVADLSEVLPWASIDPASLPAGLAIDGDTLTWAVPDVAAGDGPATVSFTVTVSDEASTGPLTLSVAPEGLGATCGTCEISTPIEAYAIDPVGVATIGGTPAVGETLTADPGEWAEGTTFAFQWFRVAEEDLAASPEDDTARLAIAAVDEADLVAIDGATGATYEVRSGDVGYAFVVAVTGTLPGYVSPAPSVSEPTAVVLAPQAVPSPTDPPTDTPTDDPDGLAVTGTDGAPLLTAALLLFVVGAASTIWAVRRRRDAEV